MRLGGRVWVSVEGKPYLGEGRVALLKAVRDIGSIHAAAKSIKMSYKAAWDTIDAMNNLAPTPLVVRTIGGKHGGGTVLTQEGAAVIEAFDFLKLKHDHLLSLLSEKGTDIASVLKTAQRITMKTSARNQLAGTIAEIKRGAVNSELVLTLREKTRIIAIVTNDGVDEMGLTVGDDAYALIKSSWIILSRSKPEKISVRNAIQGVVSEVVEGKVSVEIKLSISGGNTLIAVITEDAQKELGFKTGDTAWALFKASHVIIGA
ncbi:ModE family transcriptional regulator [Campylobacterota bacterium]|nr:ModE family transcriptional regulator [Campylobacterota bacterium]GHV07135.1 ModE family transcriptional regulator [Campylobacterota bacterium]